MTERAKLPSEHLREMGWVMLQTDPPLEAWRCDWRDTDGKIYPFYTAKEIQASRDKAARQ